MRTPKPDTLYESNGYFYKTDSKGQLAEASGDLRLSKAKRNKGQQRNVGNSSNISSDHGGHMIGAQFDGLGEGPLHMVPQSNALNNGKGSGWTAMEREWAKELNDGNLVSVKIEIDWPSNGSRPDGFDVTYSVIDKVSGAEREVNRYFAN